MTDRAPTTQTRTFRVVTFADSRSNRRDWAQTVEADDADDAVHEAKMTHWAHIRGNRGIYVGRVAAVVDGAEVPYVYHDGHWVAASDATTEPAV